MTERASNPASATRRDVDHAVGCLLGGAAGDALGAPVEFASLAEIEARFGQEGIRDFIRAYGRIGAITDDTQMTMFTAEGLIQASIRGQERGIWHPASVVHHAYLRWLATQGERAPGIENASGGWLSGLPELRSRRGPGNTCLSSLRSGAMGVVESPTNDSKGCGGIMRVAPVGLLDGADPFRLGCEVAAITHGHPTGYLAAGFFAATIASVVGGTTLKDAIAIARRRLASEPSSAECLRAVDLATSLASTAAAESSTVERLGEGWLAEEALAIAIFCALTARDFESGVALSVRHSGDSDSSGSLTGSLLGVMWGKSAIPARWLDRLELRDEIERLANDLARVARYEGTEPFGAVDVARYVG